MMVTVGDLINALFLCDKSASVPINIEGHIAWLSEIRVTKFGTVSLSALYIQEDKNEDAEE